MPRIKPELANSVFFLFKAKPGASDSDVKVCSDPIGTGFLVSRDYHYYAVTNRHVVHKYRGDVIRVNTKNGLTRLVQTEPDKWVFNPQGDDLAIMDVTDRFYPDVDEVTCVEESRFATESFVQKFELGMGEDLFMIGLFAEHFGDSLRNIPSTRFGNLSMLASHLALVQQPYNNRRPSFLADMRSRTGYSGSPVFAYRTSFHDLTGVDGDNFHVDLGLMSGQDTTTFFRLLGVNCAQYPEDAKIREVRSRSIGAPTRYQCGDHLRVDSAMNIVIPAWRITELLEHSDLKKIRDERDIERSNDRSIPRPQANVNDGAASPSAEANPDHREDFMRLVDVASRKRPRDDQT